MPSTERAPSTSRDETLLAVAHASVASGLRNGRPLEIDPALYPTLLRAPGACFVTLRIDGVLRGCTGTLEALDPLVTDVARNAHRSAFADPRFPALAPSELAGLETHISILSPLEPFAVSSEAALLEQLRPGTDGLVLRDGSRAATFLPAVWRSLPAPRDFLAELKRKAGLPPDHWSPTLTFQRYTAEEIDDRGQGR